MSYTTADEITVESYGSNR